MIAMALLVDDKLYYRENDKNETVHIGPDKFCNLVIPELEKNISVTWKNKCAEIKVTSKMGTTKYKSHQTTPSEIITAQLGKITVIDEEKRIAVLFVPVSESHERVYFDSNRKISVGRVDKIRDGSENDIVINLPFVSSRQMEIISLNGKLLVRDSGSTNGTFVNGEKIVQKEIIPGDVISVLTVRMVYDGISLSFFNTGNALTVKKNEKAPAQRKNVERSNEPIIFERSVRLKESIQVQTIVIPSPPSMGEKPKIDYLSTFLPAFITVSIGMVMFFVGGNATSLIYSLPMSLSGVFMSVFNYRKQTWEYDTKCKTAEEEFKSKIYDVEEKLKNFNARQISVMNAEIPEIPRLMHAAQMRTSILWNRSTTDPDFLNVRLGVGKTATQADVRLDIPAGAADSDQAKESRALKNKYAYVENAPICCNIQSSHITGIVGTPVDTNKLIRNMLIQLTASHCYTDLKIVYLDSNPAMAWAAKLPHVNGLWASSREEADEVLKSVIPVLKEREKALSTRNTYGKPPAFFPHILFVLADPSLLRKNYDTQRYIMEAEQLGAGVVMAVEEMTQLPINSKTVIRLHKKAGEIFFQDNVSQITGFVVEEVAGSAAERFAAALENVRVREESKADAVKTIPAKYSFYDMLGIKSAKDLDLKKRWQESNICKALKAPLGIGSNGLVELDISGSDFADGPHGLVAGMTGSGKSETIVSYMLALATLYSPLDLSFVIVDFKGGAMCNKFKGIPHLVGSITNLADKEIERSLKVLDAEIKHRQRLLQEASDLVATHDIDSVNKYTRLFKAGKVKEPMPHLLIVVDEFAELKAEYPEFLKKLVSVARIGRSLGVHLILATQKPAGQVSDQIWSNSKFRICLKVQTEQDSKEVIKTDHAANIKQAGRAYLMVGNNERYELLQSGYSGVPDAAAGPERLSQFNVTVNHIAEFCERERIPKLPELFMEPLPERVAFASDVRKGDAVGTVDLGIFDDPSQKTQGVHSVSLVSNNLLIIGSSQMGKTTMLQTIIRNLAERYTPQEVAIYILDFASQLLRKYADLNHVGGVVTSTEDEKIKHLMQLLENEFSSRKEKFTKAGVSSLAAYRELGGTDIPHIVVIIDNFTALKELYFQEDAELIRLCRDGLSVGITVIAANSQTKGLSYKYLSYFDSRIALYNNDSTEYGNLFDHCRETVEKIPGRYLAVHDNRLLDCQSFLTFDGNLNSETASFNARINAQYEAQRAAKIPELPQMLSAADLVKQCSQFYQVPYSIALGLDYETVGPVVRNLRKTGCLSLSGGAAEAQSACLTGIIRQMDMVYSGKTKVWILDSIDRMLQPLEKLPDVVKYTVSAAAAPEFIAELEQKAKSRMAMLEFGDPDCIADAELLVLVINNPNVADTLNSNKAALMSYTGLISKYKDMGICVLVSNVPNAAFISSEFYKKSVENKQFLWFDNLPALKIVTAPYTVTKKFNKKLEAGDMYLFNDTECMKLKMPLD